MSQIVTTDLGRFRRVADKDQKRWLWECPKCLMWCNLSDEQWAGKVSVNHDADGCPGHYHETHNYGAELVAKLAARRLMEEPLTEEDVP